MAERKLERKRGEHKRTIAPQTWHKSRKRKQIKHGEISIHPHTLSVVCLLCVL